MGPLYAFVSLNVQIVRLISHRQPHDTCQGPSNTNMKISQEPKVRDPWLSPPTSSRLIVDNEAIYKRIPRDTEILLTHTPAFGVLDTTKRGTNAGCPVLSTALEELRQCRMHVFGHIHEAHGAIIHEGGERVSVNAAMSGGYGQAVIVDLKHG